MSDSVESITPAVSLEAALPLLRRPPAPQAVKFRPLADLGDRCQVVAYTDARFVIDCLNAVCGGHWHATYRPVDPGLVPSRREDEPMLYARCDHTVFEVTRSDVGECRDDTRHGAGPKALLSDALKRAAVQFGVNQASRKRDSYEHAKRRQLRPRFVSEGVSVVAAEDDERARSRCSRSQRRRPRDQGAEP